MSQGNDNRISGSNENAGFQTALLFNIPEMKELNEGIENARLSYSDTPRLSDPKNELMKNYISSDLLQRLEQYSPTKSFKSIEKKMSDICLISCDKAIEELNQPMKETARVDAQIKGKMGDNNKNSVNRDKTRRRKEAEEEEENSNFQTGESFDYERLRNYRLKSQVIKDSLHKVMNSEEEFAYVIASPYQNLANFSSMEQKGNAEDEVSKNIEGQNAYSPHNCNQLSRLDSTPLYNYYDGTNKFLSQVMFKDKKECEGENPNLFGLGNSNNFIKKVKYDKAEGMCGVSTGGGILKKSEGNLDELINSSSPIDKNYPYNNYFDDLTNQSENQQGGSSSYFDSNMRSQCGFSGMYEFQGMNQMKENFEEENVNFSNPNNPSTHPRQWNLANPRNQEIGSHGKTDDYSNFGQLMSGIHGNQGSKSCNKNALEGGNCTNNVSGKKVQQDNSRINNYSSEQGTILKNQLGNKQVGGNKNIANVNSVDNSVDYIVEMFGRKGWICDKCNNFNYETRIKCNRCGVAKCPKRNIKGIIGNKPDKTPQIIGGEDDNISFDEESSFNKIKKKPFVERIGDWVCIKCKNLNFSFRVVCNRCQLPKADSDKMFEAYMNNLMYYMKGNDMQNQMMMPNPNIPQQPLQQHIIHPNNLMNNNSINCNYNYYNKSLNKGSMHMGNQNKQYSQIAFGGSGGALPLNNFNANSNEVVLNPWNQQAKQNPTANSKFNMQNAITMPVQSSQGMKKGPITNLPTSMNMMNINPMGMMVPRNAMNNPFQMGGNNYENEDEEEQY